MARDTLFSGESKNIEYKVTLPDKSEKYMKTIVAFANTQGGKLVVGVDDKTHEIVGVENEILFQLMDGIANAVSDSCMPQIIPDIEPQTVDEKTVIIVSVEAGKNRGATGRKHMLSCYTPKVIKPPSTNVSLST